MEFLNFHNWIFLFLVSSGFCITFGYIQKEICFSVFSYEFAEKSQ